MYFKLYYISIFYNIIDNQKQVHHPKNFQLFFMSSELIFFYCSYGDSVGFVFYGIFSVSFLEGSDLENGSYMGNYRLLEDTCFLSSWEYYKHGYRNTVLTSLN